jgi:hypothetical protein
MVRPAAALFSLAIAGMAATVIANGHMNSEPLAPNAREARRFPTDRWASHVAECPS